MKIIPYTRYIIRTRMPLSGVRTVLNAHIDSDNGWAVSSDMDFFGSLTDTEFDVKSTVGGKGLQVALRGRLEETDEGTKIEVEADMPGMGFFILALFLLAGPFALYMGIVSRDWFHIGWGAMAVLTASGQLAFWQYQEKRIEDKLCGWLGGASVQRGQMRNGKPL